MLAQEMVSVFNTRQDGDTDLIYPKTNQVSGHLRYPFIKSSHSSSLRRCYYREEYVQECLLFFNLFSVDFAQNGWIFLFFLCISKAHRHFVSGYANQLMPSATNHTDRLFNFRRIICIMGTPI